MSGERNVPIGDAPLIEAAHQPDFACSLADKDRTGEKRLGEAPDGALHVARTVCRRAERRMIALDPPADAVLVRYINRLSDLLFVLARTANHRAGVPESEW